MLNKIIYGDCVDKLKTLDSDMVDLVVTSPPYDNLRAYNNSLEWGEHVWQPVADELFRVVKSGGVVVWVVGDAVLKGSETGTSFKQALYFKEIGFNLHDTMIYEKNSSTFPARKTGSRYTQIFEYMFVFSKGLPACTNLICDKPNKWAGFKDYSGKLKNPVPDFSPRNNIWKYTTSKNATGHPAPFPLELAQDHIMTWTNEGAIVLDPFAGSGTVGVACQALNRNYILIEKELSYFEAIKTRLKGTY